MYGVISNKNETWNIVIMEKMINTRYCKYLSVGGLCLLNKDFCHALGYTNNCPDFTPKNKEK